MSARSRQCLALTSRPRCAKKPSTPALAYSSRQRRHRTLNDMSLGRLSMPSSSRRRTNVGYVRRLNTMNPVSTASVRPPFSTSCVGVPAEPVVLLEERHVVGPGEQVGGSEARHPRSDHGNSHVPQLVNPAGRVYYSCPPVRGVARIRGARRAPASASLDDG
ncbi:MAG: hypothetical protein R2712_01820 [Vicinamibacterales bacterium]